jgi:hypothetical protein
MLYQRPTIMRPKTNQAFTANCNPVVTTIEVMLSAMRELWDEGTSISKREAARIARDAAPYVHPRLASIDQTVGEKPRFVIHAPMPCSVEGGRLMLKQASTARCPQVELNNIRAIHP